MDSKFSTILSLFGIETNYSLRRCDGAIQHPAQEIFSNAKAFKAVSYPGAGHGLNLAANATGAFQIITDFLGESGL